MQPRSVEPVLVSPPVTGSTVVLKRIRYQDAWAAGVHENVGFCHVVSLGLAVLVLPPLAGHVWAGVSDQPRWKTRSSPITASRSVQGP
jgi:hypothetical protein